MTISGILEEEQFDLFCDLNVTTLVNTKHLGEGEKENNDLDRREERSPLVYELGESAVRPAFLDLAKSSKDRQFVISHAHVSLTNPDISDYDNAASSRNGLLHLPVHMSRLLVQVQRWV